METSRREFIKYAAAFSSLGLFGGLPEAIQRALAIAPTPGSTFLDAEHVVVLMQENRSFDHAFGSLRGVRGFQDPQAIRLPNGLPVWAQTAPDGSTYVPFRMDLTGSKATWMGSLPHSWTDQVDARHDGRYDRWLECKASGDPQFKHMPLALGYYTREDLPFYYAFADAFTICDHNFCSSLTGTTPNRLYLWSGTCRGGATTASPANVLNSDVDYGRWASWTTFPERLQDLGVSWKVYQNELSLDSGLRGEHEDWLANFTDNPLEWFSQFRVHFATGHRRHVANRLAQLPAEIKSHAQAAATDPDAGKRLKDAEAEFARLSALAAEYSQSKFEQLSPRERELHERAFTTNIGDERYHQLEEMTYEDEGTSRTMQVPAGDPLFQFRADVAAGTLPAVSWLVPSCRLSDHPGSAWYGALYVSEVLDILTSNPDVWRKTIFIVTYDENDGYFDHVPPFLPPHPAKPETGKVSKSIDASLDFVTLDQDRVLHADDPRESGIGLGYRVPMLIASPWSRGGAVCSQVFDHTSVIQLMEKILSHRLGREVRETNITSWRRAVCGDLTAAFSRADESHSPVKPIDSATFLPAIHRAQFKDIPRGYAALSAEELAALRKGAPAPQLRQEAGTRLACPLPYELFVRGEASREGSFRLEMEARRDLFGDRASGAPFTAYAHIKGNAPQVRQYAAAPGESVVDHWPLDAFEDGRYAVDVHGPNGFVREFRGSAADPALTVEALPPEPSESAGSFSLRFVNGTGSLRVSIVNRHGKKIEFDLGPGERISKIVSTPDRHGWYDVVVQIDAHPQFTRRFAGHVENGAWTQSDPSLGEA